MPSSWSGPRAGGGALLGTVELARRARRGAERAGFLALLGASSFGRAQAERTTSRCFRLHAEALVRKEKRPLLPAAPRHLGLHLGFKSRSALTWRSSGRPKGRRSPLR